ncbi:hypothetical protein BDF22DRAFT_684110 [Syncephalis plumigaleata]|nr:hypothetical protein BDF22DRAFT_684110 [Syncephalis plumigaleata]
MATNTDSAVRVQIYGSSVSGNRKIKAAQTFIKDKLENFEIPYKFIDLAADEEAKLYMRRKNGGATELPQIFVDGEFRGTASAFEDAVEYDELDSFLDFNRQNEDEALLQVGESLDEADVDKLLEEDAQRDKKTKEEEVESTQ